MALAQCCCLCLPFINSNGWRLECQRRFSARINHGFAFGAAQNAGETITLGAQTTGTRPMLYRWRRVLTNGASLIVANHFANSSVDFLTVPNVPTAFDSAYLTVTLTNAAYPAQNRTYTNAFLTVLADSNGMESPTFDYQQS